MPCTTCECHAVPITKPSRNVSSCALLTLRSGAASQASAENCRDFMFSISMSYQDTVNLAAKRSEAKCVHHRLYSRDACFMHCCSYICSVPVHNCCNDALVWKVLAYTQLTRAECKCSAISLYWSRFWGAFLQHCSFANYEVMAKAGAILDKWKAVPWQFSHNINLQPAFVIPIWDPVFGHKPAFVCRTLITVVVLNATHQK